MEQNVIGDCGSWINSDLFITKYGEFNFPFLREISIYGCVYNLNSFNKLLFKKYSINCPIEISHSIKKRQAEYLAGRYMSMKALNAIGIGLTDIRTGLDRSPMWPENITGSITHTDSVAFSAVSRKEKFDYIGIDFENIFSVKTVKEVEKFIVKESEKERLKKDFKSINYPVLLTFVFSAKESLFKALYPNVGYYFDFSVAEIVYFSENEKTFSIRLTKSLNTTIVAGSIFEGCFQIFNDSVLTCVYSSRAQATI